MNNVPRIIATLSRRRSLMVFVLVGLLAAAGITAFSISAMQKNKAANADMQKQTNDESKGRYVTTDKDGNIVVLDRDKGKVRPLTDDEQERLANGLRMLINNSDEGLTQVRQKDGSVSMDLEGHFQNVMLARKDGKGNAEVSCVDNLEAASEFFQIDPTLVGLAKRKAATQKTEQWPVK